MIDIRIIPLAEVCIISSILSLSAIKRESVIYLISSSRSANAVDAGLHTYSRPCYPLVIPTYLGFVYKGLQTMHSSLYCGAGMRAAFSIEEGKHVVEIPFWLLTHFVSGYATYFGKAFCSRTCRYGAMETRIHYL